MVPINLLLFGDQTVDKLPSIKALVRYSKKSAAVRRFLREATDILQVESSKLNPEERDWFHRFDTILNLAEKNSTQDEPSELIATLLMCVGRLGELILLVTTIQPTVFI